MAHCGHNISSLRCGSKIILDLFFLLHDITDGRFILTIDPHHNLITLLFSFFIKLRLFTFCLKEALYGFSFTYLNHLHYTSCTWGKLLSKKVSLEQKHDNLTTKMTTKINRLTAYTAWIPWTKGLFPSWMGWSRRMWDFIMPHRIAI
jgi:hypothetical protein